MDECYVVGAYLLSLSTTPIIIMACPLRRAPNPNKLQTEESAKRGEEIERGAHESERARERERFKSRADMQIEMQKR
jgi:hypothetical protein